ncbi:hypothetical protein ACIGKQ_22395 [Gordonia sp. NPDC062954]|uniref:hypothetical protein n=1 Tax=Gordonia sp. NPDC062954 TaxID=3364003 RepID=UPI0037C779AA
MSVLVVVVAVAGVSVLGKMALAWIDNGMTQVRTHESADDARDFVEGFGAKLTSQDHIDYGEVQSSFMDPSAYIVVTTSSPDRVTELLRASHFPPPRPVRSPDQVRGPADHGPVWAPTLVRSKVTVPGADLLVAVWDPKHAPRALYISAYQM